MISFIINYNVVGSLLPNPSEEIRKKAEEAGIWNQDMRPSLWTYNINLGGCRTDGCHYMPNFYASPSHMRMMADKVQDYLHSNSPDDSMYGAIQIRCGDAINECDTRLKTMKAYFACPCKGTEEVGRNITLLVMSDERDAAYVQAIVVVDDHPHISIVDLDSTMRRMV